MRNLRFIVAAAVLLAAHRTPLAIGEDATPFDGLWNVTLNCPPHHEDDGAKGYVHRFPAVVTAGKFRGTHGTEGQPGWHLLSGAIQQDGSATLALEGIVNNPDYSVNHAFRGKPYAYRVQARFAPSSGIGQRVGKRKCDLQFKRP